MGPITAFTRSLGVSCAGCGRADHVLCATCREGLRAAPPPGSTGGATRVVAAWAYEGALRELVLRLKLSGRRGPAGVLAEGMAAAAGTNGLVGSTITWVPGRPRDMRRRGFDHAELLAKEVGVRLGLRAVSLLDRRGDPPHQTELAADERRANLSSAFVARPCSGGIILVDDLVTTGSTVAACASALEAGGAGSVEALVACRA